MERIIGKWEMADGTDYISEFTRGATLSVRNRAGEPQVLIAGDENLPFRMISDSVIGVPNRGLDGSGNVATADAGYFFIFSISVEGDLLTMRGQPQGETIILSPEESYEVRFPGSEDAPLSFIRRE